MFTKQEYDRLSNHLSKIQKDCNQFYYNYLINSIYHARNEAELKSFAKELERFLAEHMEL